MESSFFEYRNETGADSDSDTEFIDNSLADESLGMKKKNGTVFVAESDESATNGDSDNEPIVPRYSSKSVIRRSVADKYVVLSSDDDASKRGSIRRQSDSPNKLVLSSSDEEQASPEIVPKKRPPTRPKSMTKELDESVIGRKTRKRMILLDSDADNSIVIEQDKHKKLLCMKDTPLKIDNGKNQVGNESEEENEDVSTSADEELESDSDYDSKSENQNASSHDHVRGSKANHSKEIDKIKTEIESNNQTNSRNVSQSGDESEVYETDESEGDDIDEDKMVMSRATRMSIMGIIPKDNDSNDDSDFIQSDDSHRKSGYGSTNSLTDLPDVSTVRTDMTIPTKDAKIAPQQVTETPKTVPAQDVKVNEQKDVQDLDCSRITCSPFSSPLRDISNRTIDYELNDVKNKHAIINEDPIVIDEPTENPSNVLKNKVLSKLAANKENYVKYDDDVTIIDIEPEIIALSSDDDEVKPEKSPKIKKSPKPKKENGSTLKPSSDIKQYLVPPSYPNQVVYVKKSVRENELMKLEALKEDLKNIRYLLEQMDVNTLPDRGAKVIERLTRLEAEVRHQGDKVASMLVEPDKPTAADIARDGFDKDKGLSWDDIQKASNAVQPRMFGKQAMATHMAERHLILDRLRDLYESLASCPAETELAKQPSGVTSELMPHQLHALAWLRWRETQRPRAGILADDMGLGKTITMIALMVSDKEARIDDEDVDYDDDPPAKGKLSRGGTLVVCPASLMQQWAGEVGKHCAAHALSVCLHHGPARAQAPHRLATYDLVVTTYNILQRDNEKNGVLMRIAWRRAILDEAHIVRNHKSATSTAVSALRAGRRWCLTGTPVQNKDLDLFALLKFLRCAPFDDLAMWKKWVDNKSLGGQERLNTVMRCVLLRRTKLHLQQKGQLDCLPERSAHEQQVTLSKAEMNVYQKVLVFSKTLFAQFLHQRAKKSADGGLTAPEKDSAYAKMHKRMIALQGAKPVKSHEILVLLLRLRQVCCHCGLIAAMLDDDAADVDEDPAGKDLLAELNKLSLEDSKRKSKNEQEKEEEEDEGPEVESTTAAEAIRSVLSPNNPVFDLANHSSKIKAVMDCLERNVLSNDGDKAVVVSQWTSVLRLVERELAARRVRSVTLSGNVPVPARPPLISALNDPRSDVRVMLLSLCAGGVGLNLCGANHLLLLDPHWNPQLEEQAQDRIYRVGQKKHVHIYRFMCVDTVEQTIRKLQQAKLELAENVLTGAKNTNASKLSIEDLKMLFNMGQ